MNRGHQPVRTCIVCRRKALKSELVRFAGKQGEVVEDMQKRESGRGVYCCPAEKCSSQLLKNKKKLNKALRLQDYSNEDGSN